ncbi:MAG: glycosyl hydrolase, partial [Nitrospirae bacterium]|nr:glycosyl hydrolase [Nitrospirota bacterium]
MVKKGKRKTIRTKRAGRPVSVLVGTRKGAFILRSDAGRTSWKLTGPIFLGHIVNHFTADPRDRKTWLIAAKTGHLGPTIFRT